MGEAANHRSVAVSGVEKHSCRALPNARRVSVVQLLERKYAFGA
ncbi:hypothetical protein C7410_12970 [Paraburkholderia silvatlantica]|uniref:Uncharacterized protein n=1 Tax=Paraburkholderia silvatlantica TaxID=321895 RepID=A0A2V4TDY7_9BURK|nr:hypothetical protein C7410_12970 [Paraburkholderia silvatlantica]